MKKILLLFLCALSYNTTWTSSAIEQWQWKESLRRGEEARANGVPTIFRITAQINSSKNTKKITIVSENDGDMTIDGDRGLDAFGRPKEKLYSHEKGKSEGGGFSYFYDLLSMVEKHELNTKYGYLSGHKTSTWLIHDSTVTLASLIDHDAMAKLPKDK